MVGIVRPGDGFIVNENFFLLATPAYVVLSYRT